MIVWCPPKYNSPIWYSEHSNYSVLVLNFPLIRFWVFITYYSYSALFLVFFNIPFWASSFLHIASKYYPAIQPFSHAQGSIYHNIPAFLKGTTAYSKDLAVYNSVACTIFLLDGIGLFFGQDSDPVLFIVFELFEGLCWLIFYSKKEEHLGQTSSILILF